MKQEVNLFSGYHSKVLLSASGPAVQVRCLLSVHCVIQFSYPAGKWAGRYQVEFYFVFDVCKQWNAPSKNNWIDK